MLTSFYSALTGLNANALYLSIIGNNLANLNTIGFKANITTFGDLLSQTMTGGVANGAGNPLQIGLGTQLVSTTPLFTQGSLMTTGEATSMAILGNGFFIMEDVNGTISYTRAGNFTLDKDGNLVAPDGSFVQGWTGIDPVTGLVIPNTALSNIKINPGDLNPPKVTDLMSHVTNLSADAAITDAYSTSVVVYDSMGTAHTVTYTFTKTAALTWDWAVTSADADALGGGSVTNGTGTLTFDASGNLTAPTSAAEPQITFDWNTTFGAANSVITWDIWDTAGTTANLTSYGSPSSTSSTSQNGYGAGTVSSFVVRTDGVIEAIYSNGQTAELAQVALANFNNPHGLIKLGANLYGETITSGAPSVGEAATGGRGAIAGNALELSNVDIAQEFTNIITAQRGYQANSRVITTSDELMQEAINIKR